MVGIVQIFVLLLVVVSFAMIVAVPVILATPGEWESSKTTFNRAFQAWVLLIIAIAAADGISSSI